MDKIEIIETNMKKPCALYKGYQYRIHRKNQKGTISWLCRKERSEKCKGRISTNGADVISETLHVCKPDSAACEIQKHVSTAKKRAREEDVPNPQIYNDEFSNVINQGYDFVTQVPLYSTMKCSLNRIRRQARGIQKDPKCSEDIQLTNDLLLFQQTNENFLLADENIGGRMIICATTKGKQALEEHPMCFIDGTFKSCSKQFGQLYTIHVDIGSTQNETNVIPVAYAFLPNKQKRTYERFFTSMRQNVPNWNPEVINTDFEDATIQAINQIFPNVNIHGCNFHMNQCLWRKVQELGLVRDYTDNAEIRLHIRMCAALAHLPIEDIDEGWLTIQETSPNDDKLQLFYDYYVENWLENSIRTKELWNCYGLRHRTNNAVEGWHFKLNCLIKHPQPNFFYLLQQLKKEAKYNDYLIDRRYLNLHGKKRKSNYVALDEQIEKTLEVYKSDNNIKACLRKLAYIQKLQ